MTLEVFEVENSQQVEGALRRLVASRPHAALLASDTLLLRNRNRIVVINRKAAAGLGLKIPPTVLVRADEVVE